MIIPVKNASPKSTYKEISEKPNLRDIVEKQRSCRKANNQKKNKNTSFYFSRCQFHKVQRQNEKPFQIIED